MPSISCLAADASACDAASGTRGGVKHCVRPVRKAVHL